jgi:hypothetical protein
VRPAGCWARKDVAVAVEQTTGRDRLNIHGAMPICPSFCLIPHKTLKSCALEFGSR